MNLPTELIRSINAGQAIALVGSGPSTEMGYPSWDRLAVTVAEKLITDKIVGDETAYRECLDKKQYPELFQQVQFDCGGRKRLIDMLKALLIPTSLSGRIYDVLCRWPFPFYLTTNYDNEIYQHLDRSGIHFSVLQNRLEDFHHIHIGASHLVFKIHGDLHHPHEAIITSADYKTLQADKEGEYFRAKLRSIFDIWDVVIVGHSFTDPDLRLILQAAQQSANPKRPIYMVATGINTIQVREFFENFNIVIVSYSNPDGTHDQLRKLLGAADKFITPRNGRLDLPPPIDAQESDAATSMLIFRRLRTVHDNPGWHTAEYVGPLILQALTPLSSVPSIEDLLQLRPFSSMVSVTGREPLIESIQSSAKELISRGFLDGTAPLRLTDEGRALALELKSTRELEKSQAYGQFAATLRQLHPALDEHQSLQAQTLIEQCIVEAFRKRGLAIANGVFGDQSIGPDDLTTLFASISQASAHLDPEIQIAFTEAAHEFIVTPKPQQRSYLTSLSQGFFLFHMLGYDATCAKIRQDLFERTVWFCDSSVLIPLLAVDSQNHAYAVDVFERLRKRGVRPYVTRQMSREIWNHLEWAIRFIRDNPTITASFMAAALVKPGYKQNLFLDGFIRASANGTVSGFEEYIKVCGLNVTFDQFLDRLASENVLVTDMAKCDGFVQTDWGDVQHLADEIKDDRASHMIYRSDDQVFAEAEVLFIIQQLRAGRYDLKIQAEKAYFISQSNVLNRVSKEKYVTTWTPEAVYRYILSLPGEMPDPILLQECMLHEYYQAGISVIDKDRYLRFFGPSIRASRIRFEEQKAEYLKDVESAFGNPTLDQEFERTPELDKPLFVHRLTLRSVEAAQRLAREALERAEFAERKVRMLEQEKASKWRSADRARIKQAAAEEKNRANPKHTRKRQRQHKRSSRKKS